MKHKIWYHHIELTCENQSSPNTKHSTMLLVVPKFHLAQQLVESCQLKMRCRQMCLDLSNMVDKEAMVLECTSLIFWALGIHTWNIKKLKTCSVCVRQQDNSLTNQLAVSQVGLQMICAEYDSRKLTGQFAQDDSRNRG